jgi:hypothetical protein
VVLVLALLIPVEGSKQVANNMPNEPGDENFPPEPDAGEVVELEKTLPVINVKYKWPASTFNYLTKLSSVQGGVAFKRRIQNAIDAVDEDEKELLDAARLVKEQIEALTVLATKKGFQLRGGPAKETSGRVTSFLGTSYQAWTDPYVLRDALYLTQLMRTPAQASLNVVEHEDAHQLQEHAKYKAMESAARYLRGYVDAGVHKLEASA